MSRNTYSYQKYKDTRTWGTRMHNLDANWAPKMPLLVDAYLKYRFGSPPPQSQAPAERTMINVLDIYMCATEVAISRAEDQTSNVIWSQSPTTTSHRSFCKLSASSFKRKGKAPVTQSRAYHDGGKCWCAETGEGAIT